MIKITVREEGACIEGDELLKIGYFLCFLPMLILINLLLNDKMHYSQKASEGALEFRWTGVAAELHWKSVKIHVGALRTEWLKRGMQIGQRKLQPMPWQTTKK